MFFYFIYFFALENIKIFQRGFLSFFFCFLITKNKISFVIFFDISILSLFPSLSLSSFPLLSLSLSRLYGRRKGRAKRSFLQFSTTLE